MAAFGKSDRERRAASALQGDIPGGSHRVRGRSRKPLGRSRGPLVDTSPHSLTGTPHESLREWKNSRNDEFYVNRKPLLKSVDAGVEGVSRGRALSRMEIQLRRSLLSSRGSPGPKGSSQRVRLRARRSRSGSVRRGAPQRRSQEHQEQEVKRKGQSKGNGPEERMGLEGIRLKPRVSEAPHKFEEKAGLQRQLGTSTSSRSLGESDQEELFPEEAQARHIARKYPALLARYALKEAKKRLLSGLGEGSESPKPVPVFVRYYRQVFSQARASVPMKREYLTLAMMLDSMLEGGMLKSMDVAAQRLKAVEQISQGVPAQVANRLELIAPEMATLASTEEARTSKGKWGGKALRPKGSPAQASEVVQVKE